MAARTPLKYQTGKHTPFEDKDTVDLKHIQLSKQPNNLLNAAKDGLYVGNQSSNSLLYIDAARGVDTNVGSAANPLKTIDGAMKLIQKEYPYSRAKYVIALRAGQVFEVSKRYYLPNDAGVVLTFYGDALGDFTNKEAALASTLNRPVLDVKSYQVDGLYTCGGFECSVDLEGIRVNLPPSPAVGLPETAHGIVDFISASPLHLNNIQVSANGVVVNKPDTASEYGLIGVLSRTKVIFSSYAVQFLIRGKFANKDAGAQPTDLASRESFLKFYGDYLPGSIGKVFLYESTLNSANGSGRLDVYWVDVPATPIGKGATSLATYPYLNDGAYGLRYYIHNMRMNPSTGLPLNVISPRLL